MKTRIDLSPKALLRPDEDPAQRVRSYVVVDHERSMSGWDGIHKVCEMIASGFAGFPQFFHNGYRVAYTTESANEGWEYVKVDAADIAAIETARKALWHMAHYGREIDAADAELEERLRAIIVQFRATKLP